MYEPTFRRLTKYGGSADEDAAFLGAAPTELCGTIQGNGLHKDGRYLVLPLLYIYTTFTADRPLILEDMPAASLPVPTC